MKRINISVADKLPKITAMSGTAVTDNTYLFVFDFDDEWQNGVKTVYIVNNFGKFVPYIMDGNSVEIQLTDARYVDIGISQGTLVTSLPCRIVVNPSIKRIAGEEIPPPAPDVYDQIIDLLNKLGETGASPEQIQAVLEQYIADGNLTPNKIGAVAQNQGEENADKILGIDAAGEVVPVDKPSGGTENAVTYTEQELTAEEQAQARENIDAAQKPLIVTFAGSGTDNNPYTCNATYSDIKAAYDDGRDVKMYYDVTLPIDGRVGEKGVYSGIADLWDVHEMMQLVYFKDESLQDLRCIELYINGLEGIVGGYVIYKFADQHRYGAVKADPAESTDTVPARIGDDGKLYVDALPSSTKIPEKTSELTNDSGFITRVATDLTNYYSKNDIDNMISTIPKFSISVVTTLPTSDISTTTVYLVGGGSGTDLYTEYIYVDGAWEILGAQRVDLTGYATETWVNAKLADYVPVTELQNAINTALAQAKESGEFDGEDGASITITNTTESTEDGGENVVEFSDGNKMTVRNGKTGAQGDPGVYVGSEDTMPKGTIVRIDPDGEAMELVEVDDTLKLQGYAADAKVTGERLSELSEAIGDLKFDHTAYGLPELKLTGDTSAMSKDNAVTLAYEYGELSGSCTLKWQGSSSLAYEKKNYTIKFDNAFEAVEGWGAQKKYCLKANFIDHSHARNLICAKLWGQTVKSRAIANNTLNALPNAGAVDGFPIVITLNGKFHGLYTFNIPKDSWMFGMSGTESQQAILCADVYGDAVAFKALANLQNDFELEYSSDDSSDWVLTSLNRLIQLVMDSDGTNLDTTIAQYLDWDSAIDYYIYTVLIEGADNTKKNYILATYDGIKWFYSAYDMDSTFGLYWDGTAFLPADNRPTFASRISDGVMSLIWNHKRQRLYNRAKEIMSSVFSESNVFVEFSNFGAKIPKAVLDEDARFWSTIPSTSVNGTDQILNYYRMRFALAEKWLEEAMEGYAGDTGSVVTFTNWVPLSTDTDGSIFNGTGYQEGMRLSSSGVIKEQDNSVLTGYIPCTKNDIIRLTGVMFTTTGSTGNDGVTPGHGIALSLYSYLAIYDADKELLYCKQGDNTALTGIGVDVTWGTYPESSPTDVVKFDFSRFSGDMAYIRINGVGGSGADMIVTKNEEIA